MVSEPPKPYERFTLILGNRRWDHADVEIQLGLQLVWSAEWP
jgi:hypothetical protein